MFIATIEQLSQYPRGNNAIPHVRISGVPKSGPLEVLGCPRGVFGLPLGSLWDPSGVSWGTFGPLWGHFGPPEVYLEVFGGSFGCLWVPLGHLLAHLVYF